MHFSLFDRAVLCDEHLLEETLVHEASFCVSSGCILLAAQPCDIEGSFELLIGLFEGSGSRRRLFPGSFQFPCRSFHLCLEHVDGDSSGVVRLHQDGLFVFDSPDATTGLVKGEFGVGLAVRCLRLHRCSNGENLLLREVEAVVEVLDTPIDVLDPNLGTGAGS
ncbi:hypothetical protein ASF93_13790 [Microbacterium sp. Leaf347]|nr:hypothetical protein ASF93_13790 [Microbacterium sp. Leaf347]KQS02679.1 hypothetical protein ASG00_09285 [Microbacterium sp. Leaf351]OJU78133.1 MAG: hypothetical protein BGO15_02745 [Microbacterium sp. 71-23]